MEVLPQYLVNGLTLGSIYGLFALGLALIFSIMRTINFAQGGLYMVSGYIGWFVVTQLTGNYWLGCLVAVVAGAGLGYVIEKGLWRHIYGKPIIAQFILSLGLVIVLQEAILQTLGGRLKTWPLVYTTVRHIGSVTTIDQRLIVIGVCVAVFMVMLLFLQRTTVGKALRATAQNKLGAGIVGINVNRMASLSFIIGIALAAMAAVLLAPLFGLTPFMGTGMLAIAFVIIVTAGMGSIGGAILASYIIGIAQSLFAGYISVEWSYAMPFAIMMIVLMVRPLGFFGRD